MWSLLTLALCLHTWATPWRDLPGDLPDDPALVSGELPNGFRYMILPNAEPQNRISLRLLVSVGSLHETDSERGLAHFIEHMAFRGTHNRPHGELIAALQRMGINFGPDSAAFTSFDYTVYHLDLPDSSETMLHEALRVFREYASGIEFTPDDIERERGVILSEKATRDTGPARVWNRQMEYLWPSARQNQRLPIGVEKQVQKFKQKQFRAFYDAWYRPERMAVIAVGNVQPEKLRTTINELFGDLVARAPARPEPAPLPEHPGKVRMLDIYTDGGLTGFNIFYNRVWQRPLVNQTPQTREIALHEAIACDMFQRRLALAARAADAATGEPAVENTQMLPGLQRVMYGTSGNLANWEQTLTFSEQALRRAREYGFTQSELTEAKRSIAKSAQQSILYAPTRQSAQLAAELASSLLYGGGFKTAETRWNDMEGPLERTTVEDCNDAFRQMWGKDTPRILIAAYSGFDRIKQSDVEKALRRSMEVPLTPPEDGKDVEFAYTDFGTPGTVLERSDVDDLGVSLVRLGNNVLVNFKRTEFEKNLVWVNVRVGLGRIDQPANLPGISMLASHAFLEGGLGRHALPEVTQILEKHQIRMNFSVQDDALNFGVLCPPAELKAAMQVLTAYITDAGYRPEAKVLAMTQITTIFLKPRTSSGERLGSILERLLVKDIRFGWPSFDEPASRTMEDVKRWFQPGLEHSAIEMSVVGDTNVDDVLEAVLPTLGALRMRPSRIVVDGAAKVTFADPTIINVSSNPVLKQGAFYVVWPLPEMKDVHQDRAYNLLAEILGNRVRTCLRDELGAAYDASADFIQHDGFPDLNYMLIRAEVDKALVDKAVDAVTRTVGDLLKSGASEDEFLRAKTPFLGRYALSYRSNAYWSYTVLRDAQSNPTRLASARNRSDDVASLTRDEINELAIKYMDLKRAFLFKTYPDKNPRNWN